ncbi:hypothetical protein ACHRVK_10010 [Flavobacterium plurextorum]|uniref:hypothetical protein n=1 Tax=Flavobacterium plurextorum TaxID=1114867 RepID=UPI00375833CA
MKFLKIDENKGYFLKDKTQPNIWTEIDQIEKDDLLKLLDYATNENFELDKFEDSILGNKAHQIIYKHLFEKFTAFLLNIDRFKDEADNIYKDAIEKYQ